MYFDKNTYQFESVEFVRHRRTNYARVKLRPFGGKARKGFFDSLKKEVLFSTSFCYLWVLWSRAIFQAVWVRKAEETSRMATAMTPATAAVNIPWRLNMTELPRTA